MPSRRLLLCTDMDRTVIPNGEAPEHPDARPRFAAFCQQQDVQLVYVTGRRPVLVQKALANYGLPAPDFAVTDVGTRIWRIEEGVWTELEEWTREIGADWEGKTQHDLLRWLSEMPELIPQEPDQQGRHKVSFYVSADANPEELLKKARDLLEREGARSNLIWSVDEDREVGLLDVLPERADKRFAVQFLARHLQYDEEEVLFAGDSGNDLAALGSTVPAVLVANAADDVKERAAVMAENSGCPERLYIARGDYVGMNGNYAAGVLEGVWHFAPAFRDGL